MALPTYDKSKRKKAFEQLPKGAYVVKILGAKEEPNRNGNGSHITIAFDIAEGEYAGFYQNIFDNNTNEDKKWPYDAIYYLTVPYDGAKSYIWDNWNTFFADLEDSNSGFVFSGDVKPLKGKLIGGKFHIEQTQDDKNNVYDHTRLRWTCVAEDVRKGKAGKMPKDKLITGSAGGASGGETIDGFVNLPESGEEELPF